MNYAACMSTITAILEPDAHGTLHLDLPLPPSMGRGKFKVVASVEQVDELEAPQAPRPGSLKGFWMAPDFDEPLEDFKEYME